MSGPTTEDQFLGGRLRLTQPARGHRAGTDAMLLQAAVMADFRGALTDLGAGIGIVGLAAAVRAPGAEVTLVERDPDVADLARRNILANGLGDRVRLVEADVTLSGQKRIAAGLPDRSADLVLTNPPFHVAGAVRASPVPYRASAHGGAAGLLDAWIRSAVAILRPGGSLVVIHRADALARLLAALEGRAGGLCLVPVLPRADEPASRILVRATRGSRAPLSILPPIVLHEGDGFTPRAQTIHQGDASIDWRA